MGSDPRDTGKVAVRNRNASERVSPSEVSCPVRPGPLQRTAADYLPLTEDAAAQFVADWTPIVLSQLARFRLPADLAEDAGQEVLLRALRGLPKFRAESKLSTWLYTITWREGVRAAQRLARRSERETSLSPASEPAAPSAPLALDQSDERRLLQTFLDELPARQRITLGYHYLEGLSVAEIATLMEAPTGSVKAWLKRGRDRLQARWNESPPHQLMTHLDDLLRDPRNHRAVADPSMSSRVAAKALQRFQAEGAAAQPEKLPELSSTARPASRVELRAMLQRWLPSPRRAARQAVLVLCVLGCAFAADFAMQAGQLPRFDILAKYWFEDLAESFRLSMQAAPLLVAAFLATATCLLGFGLSPRARATWRQVFGS